MHNNLGRNKCTQCMTHKEWKHSQKNAMYTPLYLGSYDFCLWHYVSKNSNYNYASIKLNIKTPFEVYLHVLYLTFYLQKLELQYIAINFPQSFYCSCFAIRMLNGECGSMNRWVGPILFLNILLTSKEYQKNILWHMTYNISWHGGIFCHMYMDEW